MNLRYGSNFHEYRKIKNVNETRFVAKIKHIFINIIMYRSEQMEEIPLR